MLTMQLLDRLNRGDPTPTYKLVPAPPDRAVTGEIRYLVPLVPNPAEPLAQMLPLRPQQIMFTGAKWVLA